MADGAGRRTGGTVVASVVNDEFVAGFVVMERTLRAANPGWTMPVVALQSARAPLSEAARAVIEEHCPGVRFAVAREDLLAPVHVYAEEVLGTPERLMPAFAILEALTWSGLDRVIALDSDLIVRGSLEALLHAPCPFNAVRATDSLTGAPRGYVNTGVMVLNRTLLAGFDPAGLGARLAARRPRPGTGKADQAILNMIMHNAVTGYLPQRYNTTKRALHATVSAEDPGLLDDPDALEARLDAEGARIFHYVGEKPWNPKVRERAEAGYGGMDALWYRAFEAHARPSLHAFMGAQRAAWQERFAAAARWSARRDGGDDRSFERRLAERMGI
jgi:hypothetical protein